MTESRKGVVGLLSACMIWGLSPLYYALLSDVPPLEVLSHRILWSFVLFGGVIAVQGRVAELLAALATPRIVGILCLTTAAISVNWFLFIWSVQNGRTVETSLGYYIFPLVSVLLGVAVHGEGMAPAKAIAVALATLAVVVLAVGLGTPPWVSLSLACTFGIYGLLKKSLALGPVLSVTAEVVLVVPLALVWLIGVHVWGWTGLTGRNLAIFGHDAGASALLILSGPLTALPLILFSYGARRTSMATVGLTQYLNPTLQFGVAVFVFAEPFTRWHAIAFPIIWLGLAIYTFWVLRQERSVRRAEIRSSTLPTVVKNPSSEASAKPSDTR